MLEPHPPPGLLHILHTIQALRTLAPLRILHTIQALRILHIIQDLRTLVLLHIPHTIPSLRTPAPLRILHTIPSLRTPALLRIPHTMHVPALPRTPWRIPAFHPRCKRQLWHFHWNKRQYTHPPHQNHLPQPHLSPAPDFLPHTVIPRTPHINLLYIHQCISLFFFCFYSCHAPQMSFYLSSCSPPSGLLLYPQYFCFL